ncbi:MAG: hypothetical protein AAGJ40_22055 [Planctomycetota bacterium]
MGKIQNYAVWLGGTIGLLSYFMYEFGGWLVREAFYYIATTVMGVGSGLLTGLASAFPDFDIDGKMQTVGSVLAVGNYWLPLNEAVLMLFGVWFFAAVFFCFKLALKLIPMIG